MNGIVYCTSCSALKENMDMVNLLDHRLSMSLLFRRPRKGVCHHISRSLSSSSRHPTAGTCTSLWGPCVNKKHAVSDPDTAPRQSASCLLPKTPISPRQSASLVQFCAIISLLARFDAQMTRQSRLYHLHDYDRVFCVWQAFETAEQPELAASVWTLTFYN